MCKINLIPWSVKCLNYIILITSLTFVIKIIELKTILTLRTNFTVYHKGLKDYSASNQEPLDCNMEK